MAFSNLEFIYDIYRKSVTRKSSFNNLLEKSLQEKLISRERHDYLLNKYNEKEDDRKLISEELLKTFIGCEIEILFDLIGQTVNKTYWKETIDEIKAEKKKNYLHAALPEYALKNLFPISDIQSTIKIIEVRKKITNKCFSEISNYGYKKFFRFFTEKFKTIAIKGKPGIGKTEQYNYLTNLWTCNKWEEKNDFLLLNLRLKLVKKHENLIDAIFQQNFKNCLSINKNLFEIVFHWGKDKIVLFVDEFDEISHDCRCIKQLLVSFETAMIIVIWTRSWKSNIIFCDLVCELQGLNEEQLNLFLSNPCLSSTAKLKEFITEINSFDQEIMNLCKTPFLALHIFYLYQKNERFFKKTRYEIYSDLINFFEKNKPFKYCSVLKKIEKESYKQITSGKIILDLTEQDIKKLNVYKEKILKIFPNFDGFKTKFEIQFYDLSFQEYFASNFIVNKFKTCYIGYFIVSHHFEHIPVTNLYSIMDFLHDYSDYIMKRNFLDNKYIVDDYHLFDAIEGCLRNKKTQKSINFLANDDDDTTIFNAILKKQSFLTSIILNSVQMNNLDHLIMINIYCSNLQSLKIFFTDDDINLNKKFKFEFSKILSKFFHKISLKHLTVNGITLDCSGGFFILHSQKIKVPKLKFKVNQEKDHELFCNYTDIFSIIFYFLLNNGFCESLAITSFRNLNLLNDKIQGSLKELIVKNFYPKKIEWKLIFSILKNNEQLEKISLIGCNLTHCMHEICGILVNVQNLTEVNISNNSMEDSAFLNFLQALLPSRKSLIKIIVNNSKTFFHAEGNNENLFSKSIAIFLQFQNLQILDLGASIDAHLGFTDLLGILTSLNSNLQRLSLNDCGIKFDTQNMVKWKYLLNYLKNESYNRSFGGGLLSFKVLNEVDFSNNYQLGLGCTEILKRLFQCKLKKISFNNCGLNGECMNGIQQILYQFDCVKDVDFGNNTELGFICSSILLGLTNSKHSLEKIKFQNCGLQQENVEGIDDILQNFTTIKECWFDENYELNFGFITILNGLLNCTTSLRKLNFQNCSISGIIFLNNYHILEKFITLNDVNFGRNPLSGIGFNGLLSGLLGSKETLERLCCPECEFDEKFSEESGKILKQFNFLREFDFRHNFLNHFDETYFLDGLKSSKDSLQKLFLDGKTVGEIYMLTPFVSLSEINFTLFRYDFSSKYFKMLANSIKGLEFLNFSHCNFRYFNKEDLPLPKLFNLKKVEFFYCFKNEKFEFIPTYLFDSENFIQHLTLKDCSLGEENIIHTKDFFEKFHYLVEIDLSGNYSGCARVLNFISKSYNTLEIISFSNCQMNEGQIKTIGYSLKNFQRLKRVNLSENSVSNALKELLTGLLNSKETFQELNLHKCSLANGNEQLDNILSNFKAMTVLDLSSNENLDNNFLLMTLDGLSNSKNTLKTLNFSECSLDVERLNNIIGTIFDKFQNLTIQY